MEAQATILESLIQHSKDYAKTSLALLKLKATGTISDIVSLIATIAIIIIASLLFVFVINIGLALLIGDLLGKAYYGFLIVAGFYMLIMVVVGLFHKQLIKKPLGNIVAREMLKQYKLGKL